MAAQYLDFEDEDGNQMRFGNMGDFHIPPYPLIQNFQQHTRDISAMEMNPDDIIIAGFPKTGSHWTYEVVQMLMKGKVEYCTRKQEAESFLDMTPITSQYILPPDRPRLFYTHLLFQHLPKQVREKKVKVVYLERNPKDTWVSLFHHATGYKGPMAQMAYPGTWAQLFRLMMGQGFWYGSWFDYVLDWEAAVARETAAGLPMFVSVFEDLKKDPVTQIERLGQFLGYNHGKQLCQQIAEACDFGALKTFKEKNMAEEIKRVFKPTASGLFRKGEVGDWKNMFTVAQSEEFDQEFSVRMKGSQLRYSYQ